MDIRKIRRLIELLERSDIDEIEIREGEESVRISRREPPPSPPPATPQPMPQPSPSVSNDSPPPVQENGTEETTLQVVAPMVGTFYRAPSPEAEPLVQEGDSVQIGDPLCVIEAMKLFNEIESEYTGRIKKILVENAQPVEYGEPLFLIEPRG